MDFNQYLKVWLPFDKSPTFDVMGNSWETVGNPSVGDANAINGNALQLDGNSYIKLEGLELGGRDFYIDGWVYVDPSSPANARVLTIANSAGIMLVTVRKNSDDASKLDVWLNTSSADMKSDFGANYVSTINSVGVRVHFKIVYRYTDRIFAFCINDKTVGSRSNTYQYVRQKFNVFIGALYNGNQKLTGSIDEFRIYDGTWLSYGYETPPTVNTYRNITFYTDCILTVRNPPLEWRYENYGTADLLTIAGTTVSNLPETQSKTGSAFYHPTRQKCFDIPATNEIWIKCDVYTTANYSGSDRIRIYSEDANGINGWTSQTPVEDKPDYQIWHNGTSQKLGTCLGAGKVRTVRVHMKSDTSNGLIEVNLGSFFYSYSGNVNAGNPFENVYIQMDGSNIYVSNLIISNVPVGFSEDVAFARTVSFAVDTKRTVSNNVSFTVDTKRTVKQISPSVVEFYVDTRRTVEVSQPSAVEFTADVKRVIQNAVSASVDIRRNVIKSVEPEPVEPVEPVTIEPDNSEDDFISIVDIYDIQLRTGMIHICNTNEDITFEGNKYISIPIEREDISRSVDDIDEDVKISMADATTEQLQFIIAGFEFRGCPVRIRQIFYPQSILDNSVYRDCFYGYIDNPAFQNGEFTCTLRSRIPKITVPRRTYQSLCNCKFADSVCQMDSARVAGKITSVISGNQIIININKPSGFWRNGIITIEGESRMIQKSEGALITTFYPFFATVSAGLQFSIQRGCDKTFTSCNAFGNIEHFTGFPAIPFETIYR